MKIVFDDINLAKLCRESEKTLVEWFWQVLAQVRLVDSHQISKPSLLCFLEHPCDPKQLGFP